MSDKSATYRRSGQKGVLTLSGDLTIYDAIDLYPVTLKALADPAAKQLRVDFSRLERMDTSAMQILLCLKAAASISGKQWSVSGDSNGYDEWLRIGLSL